MVNSIDINYKMPQTKHLTSITDNASAKLKEKQFARQVLLYQIVLKLERFMLV